MARKRRKVNLSDINDPKAITLTKSPANQTSFKVIRSEEVEPEKDESPLRSIKLAAGSTNAMAEAMREAYQLSGYDVVEEEGAVSLKQTSYDGNEATVPVGIGNGHVAMIASSVFDKVATHAPVARAEEKVTTCKAPVLTALSFTSDEFPDAKSVLGWLEANKVSYPEGAVVRSDDGYLVTRQDVPDGGSSSVTFAEGVTGKVARGDTMDVPHSVYRMVAEQVYGYYANWEFIDFAVAMANPDYTTKSEDAIWVLKDVLENITIYSTLDIEERKNLIRQATESYAEYMITLLDALPTPVTMQERSDKCLIPEIDEMTIAKTEDAKTEEVARSEDAKTEETAPEKAVEDSPVTRKDIEGIVQKALESYEAKRSEDVTETTETTEAVARSEDTVDPLATIATAITAMAARMDSIETQATEAAKVAVEQEDSVTVTRTEEETAEEVQRKENVSPFVGMFGDRLQA
jgi:hypothetical protein